MSFLSADLYARELVINEFMADNASTIADENGDFEDWIELFNPGDQPVNIAGMFVTDSFPKLAWQIPDSNEQLTTIPPGGYLLLWLDKDPQQGILHMNVKLGADGESISLVRSDGTIIDSIQFGLQLPDISLGRKTDAGNEWISMETPTPGSTNNPEIYIEKSQTPLISMDAGFYNASINLVMSAVSSQIYYTQIQANPYSYTRPIMTFSQYTHPLVLTETCTIRAYAIENGKAPSEVKTKTYFIHSDDFHLPVISLTIDPEKLFDPVDGLYMKGPDVLPEDEWPFKKSNYYQGSYYYEGSKVIESWEDYEKPVHVEYFDQDNNLIFNIDAGLEITGVWSRAFPKKSFNIKARNEYGVNEIKYPLFEDNEYDIYDGITLRAGSENRSRVNNEIFYMAWRGANLRTDMQAYKPVILLLNGAYWGIYSMMERKDNDFIQNRYGYDDIDLIADWGLVKDGSIDDFKALLNYMNDNDINAPGVYDYLLKKINMPNYIDHCLMQVYSSHGDPNNIRYWRPRTPEGQWHWIIYDFDWLKDYNVTTLSNYAAITEVNTTEQLGYMLQHPEFRNAFINRLADFINTTGRSENMLDYIETAVSDIEAEIEYDIARWHDWETMNGPGDYDMGDYQWEVERMQKFVMNRPDYLFQEIESLYSPSGTATLTLSTGMGNGRIRINTTDINDLIFSGRYFKDIPITITAIPDINYTFAYWSELDKNDNKLTDFYLTDDLSLTANFVPVIHPVLINEINYNSFETFQSEDWIELYNRSTSDVDLSGWHLKDEDANDFLFPDNTIIHSNEYLVVVEDLIAFQSTYANVSNIIGSFSFGLSGGGDIIRLYDTNGSLIDYVAYDDDAPWPTEADGKGKTLELVNPDFDNSLPESWKDALINNGTPGQPNSVLNPFQSIQNVIRMLKIVSGATTSFPTPLPDIDSNDQIGLSEVIYGLKTVANTDTVGKYNVK
jgi:hypothetical protein